MTDVQQTLTLARFVDMPREKVWEAWTDSGLLDRWWWPARFQTAYEVDLRIGGQFSFRTADLPDLGVLTVSGTYIEIRHPERLAYTWRWENGDEPLSQVTIDFAERAAGTEVCITHRGFVTREDCDNHRLGWSDCLDRLEALIPQWPLGSR